MKDLRNFSINLAKQSGKILMKNFGKVKFVKTKVKESYVTNVDIESEKLIISSIKKKYPGHDIVSEEFGRLNKKSDYRWYIDPLDGTHNYINKIPFFGVSIALAFKGKVILGVINLPYFNEMFVAEKGKGAFLNGKKIRVSNKKQLKKAFALTELVRHVPETKLKMLKRLMDHVYDLRVFGSAICTQTYVAKGSADIYLVKGTNSWDIAAGLLIVEEAGGKATDFKGKDWKLESREFIASNKKLHSEILKVLR